MRFLIVVLLLGACGGKDHEGTGVEPENFFAVIYGQVVDDEGNGIANAQVRATSFRQCGDTAAVGGGTTRSSTGGRYSVRVIYPAPERVCVTVLATPPSQALLSDSVVLPNVLFARVPSDSVSQTLTLRVPGGGGGGGPINPRPISRNLEE